MVILLVLIYGAIAAELVAATGQDDTEVALIMEHKWAMYRNLPRYNIHRDPLRKNLTHGEPPPSPSSCHYCLIKESFENGPLANSVICVECSYPSSCPGKHGKYKAEKVFGHQLAILIPAPVIWYNTTIYICVKKKDTTFFACYCFIICFGT